MSEPIMATQTSESAFPFLRLPLEVQRMIYTLCYPDRNTIRIELDRKDIVRRPQYSFNVALLSVNKQLRKEIGLILDGKIELFIRTPYFGRAARRKSYEQVLEFYLTKVFHIDIETHSETFPSNRFNWCNYPDIDLYHFPKLKRLHLDFGYDDRVGRHLQLRPARLNSKYARDAVLLVKLVDVLQRERGFDMPRFLEAIVPCLIITTFSCGFVNTENQWDGRGLSYYSWAGSVPISASMTELMHGINDIGVRNSGSRAVD